MIVTDIIEIENSEAEEVEWEDKKSKIVMKITEEYSLIIEKEINEIQYLDEGKEIKNMLVVCALVSD